MARRVTARGGGTGAIRIEGLAELERDLRRFAPEVDKEFRGRLRRVVGKVAADARSRAPVKTGKLRKGIKASVTNRGAALASRARHARIHEFGGRHPVHGNRETWVYQPTRPHIFPAVNAGRPEVDREALAALDAATREVGFRL